MENTSPHSKRSIDPVELTRAVNRRLVLGIFALTIVYLFFLGTGLLPTAHDGGNGHGEAHVSAPEGHDSEYEPPFWAVTPFILLLLSIAILPLIPSTAHWWHHNKNRFLVAASLGILTLIYYGTVHPGGIANHFTHAEGTHPGLETVWAAFSNGILSEFIPFIALLFSLYVISGGIHLEGDLAAHPGTNTAFIGIGALLASFIGTTGAAMVLIRPLLSTNAERKHRVHTVVFFIFAACNCGGLLLPIGDPPLFLGYLRGVPFTWTLDLWPYWLAVNLVLLLVYFLWDQILYRREEQEDIRLDETVIRPLRLRGAVNLVYLLGVVLCVALVVPDQPFLGSGLRPPVFFRELLMLLLILASVVTTRPEIRVKNRFDYIAIGEVAALFSGIFICMQVPIEILNLKGGSLGIDTPAKFFWATGILSSFLDNAPTYVVFFETAVSVTDASTVDPLLVGGARMISEQQLSAISLGAVFMGANTYIGNGPNFMVKSIAEQAGIRMPSFFGFMLYSLAILFPIFVGLTWFL